MSDLELIAGNFGKGRAQWLNYEFHLPKKAILPIELIAAVEENGEYLETTILGAIKGGAQGAVGLATSAAVVSLFAAPLAAVGAIALTAAAIGAGVGAHGGHVERKVLLQVIAADGRGFVAICERGVPAEIAKAVSVAHAMRMRQREVEVASAEPQPWRAAPSVWEKRPKVRLLADPAPALPQPSAPQPLLLDQDSDGVLTIAGKALNSATESAGNAATEAYSAAVQSIEDAWTSVRARMPWSAKQT